MGTWQWEDKEHRDSFFDKIVCWVTEKCTNNNTVKQTLVIGKRGILKKMRLNHQTSLFAFYPTRFSVLCQDQDLYLLTEFMYFLSPECSSPPIYLTNCQSSGITFFKNFSWNLCLLWSLPGLCLYLLTFLVLITITSNVLVNI